MAVKVKIKKVWRRVSIVMYSFFRARGSLDKWDWEAMIIRGRSHVVSISRGVDSGSEKNRGEKLRLLSVGWLVRGRHRIQIIRLCIVVLIQMVLVVDSQVRGMSITVGVIIFSIVVG